MRQRLLDADHRFAFVTWGIARRLGYRGAFIGAIGTLNLIWAWSLLNHDAAQPLFGAASFQVIISYGAKLDSGRPLLPWAIILAAVGGLCIWQAFIDDDRPAYMAAIGVKVMWAILTIAAWPTAHLQVVRGTAQWLTFAIAVLICAAGLPYRRD